MPETTVRPRICLIVNPTAGQHPGANPLAEVRACVEPWAEVDVRQTDARGAGERIAGELGPDDFDLVVAAGGDGTINEVLNGLADHTPLGLLPLGTANVLARELKIPVNDLAGACELLRTGKPRATDLGWCNGRKFSLMAGIGFDAEAVKEVPPDIKDLIGAPAYVLSGLRALVQIPKAIRYRLTMPDGKFVSRGMMLVVANAASYAGPLQIAPLASIDDGLLDVCLFRERNRLAFLGQLFNVALRRQLKDPNFVYLNTAAVTVHCKPPAAVQLDGDYFGRTPVEIRTLPGAVRIVRP
jgi:YegS/Rv2252/BmrU family lipid kinase